jgi:Zn-dependent protease
MEPRWAIHLCRFRDTEVWLDASWLVLLPFIAWSLAVGYFPEHYPVFSVVVDWLMGLAAAAASLVAVLLHEAAHLLIQPRGAQPFCTLTVHVVGGMPCGGGGCCGGDRTGFRAIAAGPGVSLILAAVTFWAALNAGPFSRPLEALLGYLAIVNVLLALLHSIPAWPFDAGRLVACALARLGTSSILAARVAKMLGGLAAIGLLLLGAWQVIGVGSRLLGAWIAIGGLLVAYAIATASSRRSDQ